MAEPRTNARTLAPVLRLVPRRVDADTVEVLRELLDHAEAGEIVGIAFAAMYRQRQFITETAGEARRDPVAARGMVATLSDDLAALLRGEKPESWG